MSILFKLCISFWILIIYSKKIFTNRAHSLDSKDTAHPNPPLIFSGGFITWKSLSDFPRKIEFSFSYSIVGQNSKYDKICHQNPSRNKEGIWLECLKGCTGIIGNLMEDSCPVTNGTFVSKWKVKSITYQFKNDTDRFDLKIKGCCWRILANHKTNLPINFKISGSFDELKDLNNIKPMISTPLIDISPLILFAIECSQSYIIPVIDFGNNLVACSIASNPLNLQGISIIKEDCLLFYATSDNKEGYYPIIIEVNNFHSNIDSEDLITSTEIQVLVKMYSIRTLTKGLSAYVDAIPENSLCFSYKPQIISPNNHTCISIIPGQSTKFNVSILMKNSTFYKSKVEKLDINWMPTDLIEFSSLKHYKDDIWTQNFFWKPRKKLKEHITITIVAISTTGLRSDPIFVTLATEDTKECITSRLGFLRWINGK
ncbi:uncharacterized protein LOC135923521 isoform X2 [Gordionus sp. m RMFG-2023]|uniref:uncharacterized protein LOC135923521 isoform X2 n=1 Tax=Gordionus sp. m RMFG-2023 TaxID=3053472 RepID=UPI0031FBDC8E